MKRVLLICLKSDPSNSDKIIEKDLKIEWRYCKTCKKKWVLKNGSTGFIRMGFSPILIRSMKNFNNLGKDYNPNFKLKEPINYLNFGRKSF
jgi:hypothetical protein